MANKFVSVLKEIGKDLERGIQLIAPFAELAGRLIGITNPALGAAIATTAGVVATTEQAFAGAAVSSATSEAKLAQVVQISAPVIQQALAAEGKTATAADVKNYVNEIVGFLNAFPAGTVLPVSAPSEIVAPAA